MYLKKEEAKVLLDNLKETTTSEIRQKTDFMLSLLEEDDWTIIIKSHALIESLITELIVSKIEEPKMKALIERLPLSDSQLGKIKIAKDYDLLTRSQLIFVRRLSELRNDLVHKFENVNFNFNQYVSILDSNQKKAWATAFTWFEDSKEVKSSWRDATLKNPRVAVFLAILLFVLILSIDTSELHGLTKIRAASEDLMKRLFQE